MDVSRICLGMMSFGKPGAENGVFPWARDYEDGKEIFKKAIDLGINYFDTAWAYPGSEEAIRKALVERHPRESFLLASKNAAWLKCTSPAEAKAQLDVSLDWSGAGYFDFYLLHNLGEGRTRTFDDWKLWDWALEQRAAGRIRHLGFSFHSGADELEAILEAHPEAEFVQLQINYADWESPSIQSRRCLEVARAHRKPVIVMEPVKGGKLVDLPAEAQKIFDDLQGGSNASYAIRFAASFPQMAMVLSGMSSIGQMQDNLSYMKDFRPLSEAEEEVIRAAALLRAALAPAISSSLAEGEAERYIEIARSQVVPQVDQLAALLSTAQF